MRNHSTYCCVCILGHLILSLSRTRGPPLPLHPRSRFSGDSETSNFRSLKYLRKRSFDVYLCDLGLLRDSSLLTDFCLICCYAFMVLFLPIFLIFSDGLFVYFGVFNIPPLLTIQRAPCYGCVLLFCHYLLIFHRMRVSKRSTFLLSY